MRIRRRDLPKSGNLEGAAAASAANATIRMSRNYARALYNDSDATLDDLREAMMAFEDLAATARRVLGGAHPLLGWIERHLRESRAALRARETSSG